MKIGIKFENGDKVWFCKNNKILSGTIFRFEISKYKEEKLIISYDIAGKFEDYSVYEEDIFKTREEAEERHNNIKWEQEYNKMKEDCIKKVLEKFEKEWKKRAD